MNVNVYSDISLIDTEDAQFRMAGQRYVARYRRERERDPFAREYTIALSRCEDVLRSILSDYFHSSNERILSYLQKGKQERWLRCYREIDFVGLSSDRPAILIETKFKEEYDPERVDGLGQLNKSLEVARERWVRLCGLCINVFMGRVFQLVHTEPDGLSPLSRLADFQGLDDGGINGIWISGMDFMRLSIANHLMDSDDWENLRKTRLNAINPLSSLTPSEPLQSNPFYNGLDLLEHDSRVLDGD